MSLSAIDLPAVDPTPIFEHLRGAFSTELLAAAIELGAFAKLADGALSADAFGAALGLKPRPRIVLTTALQAMRLLTTDAMNRFCLTALSREHLVPGGPFDVSDYVGLSLQSPGVRAMLERLRTDAPAGAHDAKGAAFIFREGISSAMEHETSARALTLALAGRAKNVAPHLAANLDLSETETLLDVGGGTGIYSIACLQKYSHLRAVVWDRPEVLKVAHEMAEAYGVDDRLTCVAGDMFADAWPVAADAVLLSNILHDWDVPACRTLVNRCAEALPAGGALHVHDVFLNDALDGPLPIALYSAALFTLTEGRAYSAGEYGEWLRDAGLTVSLRIPTFIHCAILTGRK